MRVPGPRSARWVRCLAVLVALGSAAAVLSACGSGPGGTITASAVFSDVGTLGLGSQVEMADVPIGSVTGISLDGARARVTMSIQSTAAVPANVTAQIDRTSVLGQRFVNLAVPRHPDGRLHDGATIGRTAVVPTVEQVVGAGAQVFGAVSADDVAQIVDAGGQALSDEAATLRQFLDDLGTVTAAYAGQTAQITTVVGSLDQLASTLAPTSGADAQALSNLSATVQVLAQNATRFETLLQAVDDVSVQGATLLSTEYPQITAQLQALGAVSAQLEAHQQDLADLLEWLPQHDATMSESVRNDFLQILSDLIVCGVAGGGSGSTGATSCNPGTGAAG